jgi:hypothetical protein
MFPLLSMQTYLPAAPAPLMPLILNVPVKVGLASGATPVSVFEAKAIVLLISVCVVDRARSYR